MASHTIGSQVKIKCPTYKNGKTFTGIITGLHIYGIWSMVKINDNKKSTRFANCWLTIIASH